MNTKTALYMLLPMVVCLSGCRTVTVTSEHSKPAWYHAPDPAPDQSFLYFSGYSEACFNYSQAIKNAENDARERVAAYLGTQIESLVEKAAALAPASSAERLLARGAIRAITRSHAPIIVTDRTSAATLSDVFEWLRDDQIARARQFLRTQYEADGMLSALWAWNLVAGFEVERSRAMDAIYDFEKSSRDIKNKLADLKGTEASLPVVTVLLTFIQQEIEVVAAVDALWQIRNAIGAVTFPDQIGNLAVRVLKDSLDPQMAKLSCWLNNQDIG